MKKIFGSGVDSAEVTQVNNMTGSVQMWRGIWKGMH